MSINLCRMFMVIALVVPATPGFADVITDWNEKAVAFVTPRMVPPAAQRAVAIVHVAMFDAVNSIERRYRPYLIQLPAAGDAHRRRRRPRRRRAPPWQACFRRSDEDLSARDSRLISRTIADSDGQVRGHQGRRGGRRENPRRRAPGRWRGCTGRLPAKDQAGCLRSDPDHASLDVAEREAVRHDEPIAISPAAADRAQERRNGRPTTTRSRSLAARPAAKRTARQTEDATFWLITGPQSTIRSCANWLRQRR